MGAGASQMVAGGQTAGGSGLGSVVQGLAAQSPFFRALQTMQTAGQAGQPSPVADTATTNADGTMHLPVEDMPPVDTTRSVYTPTGRETLWQNGIAGIESGGRYDALGPTTKSGDRAYGKYQIMGANIPRWTKQALGTAMTPQQFLVDPKAQDATFNHIFGGYVEKYGEEGAAQAWLGGEGSIGKGHRRDQLGTSVAEYGKRFMASLNGPQPSYSDSMRSRMFGGGQMASGSGTDGTYTPGQGEQVQKALQKQTPASGQRRGGGGIPNASGGGGGNGGGGVTSRRAELLAQAKRLVPGEDPRAAQRRQRLQQRVRGQA